MHEAPSLIWINNFGLWKTGLRQSRQSAIGGLLRPVALLQLPMGWPWSGGRRRGPPARNQQG